MTVGTSTSSEAIELRVLDGTTLTKTQLVKAIQTIQNYVMTNAAPA